MLANMNDHINNVLDKIKIIEDGDALIRSLDEKDGISKALDIIETHEREELEAKRVKKEQDLLKL
jgi:hypothetical protein